MHNAYHNREGNRRARSTTVASEQATTTKHTVNLLQTEEIKLRLQDARAETKAMLATLLPAAHESQYWILPENRMFQMKCCNRKVTPVILHVIYNIHSWLYNRGISFLNALFYVARFQPISRKLGWHVGS